MQDKVTVITPVYNTPVHLLDRVVMSVLHQTYENVELILVDDHSSNPDTQERLDHYCSTKNCKIILHKKTANGGVSDSLNIGVSLANGKYYCVLDHDDYLEPDYIEKMVSLAVAEDADMVVGGMKHIDEQGTVIAKYPTEDVVYKKENFPWMSTVNLSRMYRLSIVKENHIQYPVGAWTEDVIFSAWVYPFIRKISVLSYEGYVNYINPDSASRSKSFNALRLEQIPFEAIEQLIARNCEKRDPYISGLLCNEMMFIGYSLTLFSDKAVKEYTRRQFSLFSKKLACKRKELRKYEETTEMAKLFRAMDMLFLITNKVHMEGLGYRLAELAGKRYYTNR